MPRYMIEIRHDFETTKCSKMRNALDRCGSHFITHADWGCKDGVHCGWLIADLANREEATRIVPPAFRQQARIVELTRMTRTDLLSMTAHFHWSGSSSASA